MPRTVVIVGRPNVGKSRLFNRLARRRISIVHDQPGITRDVLATEVREGGYTLLDTGGIGLKDAATAAALIQESERQADLALERADLILFTLDGLEGVTSLDERIARKLRRARERVLLVVNKADFGLEKIALEEAMKLGMGDPVCVSAEHGTGEDVLRAAILARLGPLPEDRESGRDARSESDQDPRSGSDPGAAGESPADDPDQSGGDADSESGSGRGHARHGSSASQTGPICICFIGRPNVGKSSLSNRLIGSDRLIVSDIPGTTRDAVEVGFDFIGRDRRAHPFRLIDTAGIKASTKLASPVEYFSRLRSLEAMQRSDVVFLVLDAFEGVTQQDKAIAGEAVKERKPIVIVVNKWDLVHAAFQSGEGVRGYENERDYRKKYERAVFDRLFFTPGAPLVYVSAMSGYEVGRMLNAAVRLRRTLGKKLPTARLNQVLIHLTERTPPAAIGARRFRIYYATQTGNHPFRIKLFCNREESLMESYRRYLEAGLVREFGLDGCPVEFELVGKPRGAEGSGRPKPPDKPKAFGRSKSSPRSGSAARPGTSSRPVRPD